MKGQLFFHTCMAIYLLAGSCLSTVALGGFAWNIQTVDSTGGVGGYTSIALDADGNPHISYYEDDNGDLRYAFAPGPSTYTLTMSVEPNNIGIDTVTPLVGDHVYYTGMANINAGRFLSCPDVYQFSHWEGDVANANSASTTVFMNSDKTIKSVFVATRECGDECHPDDLFGDYNNDCIINLEDYAQFAMNWLVFTKPECD